MDNIKQRNDKNNLQNILMEYEMGQDTKILISAILTIIILVVSMILFIGCIKKYYIHEVYQNGVIIHKRCKEHEYAKQHGYTDGSVYYKNTWDECGE